MTALNGTSDLSRLLGDAYPNQVRNWTEILIPVRIDDRESGDIYPGFCDIHLKMSDQRADQFQLILDNVPFDDDVIAVVAGMGGTWQTSRSGKRLTLTVSVAEPGRITRLATAIRKVVGRGKSYPDRNWKWIAPRTSRSLNRLAGVLSESRNI